MSPNYLVKIIFLIIHLLNLRNQVIHLASLQLPHELLQELNLIPVAAKNFKPKILNPPVLDLDQGRHLLQIRQRMIQRIDLCQISLIGLFFMELLFQKFVKFKVLRLFEIFMGFLLKLRVFQ